MLEGNKIGVKEFASKEIKIVGNWWMPWIRSKHVIISMTCITDVECDKKKKWPIQINRLIYGSSKAIRIRYTFQYLLDILDLEKFCQYRYSVRRTCNDYAAFIKNLVFYLIHNQPNFMVDFTAFGEKVCTCLFFLSRWQSDKSALRIDKKLRIEIWHFLSRLILKDTSCHLGLVVLQPK